MLVLVYALGHNFQVPLLLYLLHQLCVYSEIAERCTVLVASCCRGAGEVVVVRRTKEEDAFAASSQYKKSNCPLAS